MLCDPSLVICTKKFKPTVIVGWCTIYVMMMVFEDEGCRDSVTSDHGFLRRKHFTVQRETLSSAAASQRHSALPALNSALNNIGNVKRIAEQ